jgi:hypothetical protein
MMRVRFAALLVALVLIVVADTGVPVSAGTGVTPQAETSALMTADDFFALFQGKNDWTWSGADQATSLRAGNGLIYWSFGDTALGIEDPVTGAYEPGWRFVANTILVQRGGELSAAAPAAAVPDPGGGDRYWTQGMFEANGYLYVLCQRVGNTPDGWFELHGVELAKFAFNSDGTLAFQRMVETPSTGKLKGDSVDTAQYAADAVVSGSYVYIFGYSNVPGDLENPHRSYVARVQLGRVESSTSWRFYSGGQWVTEMGQATSILAAQVSSVRFVGGWWLFAYKPWNGWGDTVYVERRSTPFAAPAATTTIYSPPGTTPGGQQYQTYAPQLHPEQSLASGKLLVSIAWNGQTLGDVAADADLYKPRFYEISVP